jgi:uncharacterized protein YecT (DUF1311 family)
MEIGQFFTLRRMRIPQRASSAFSKQKLLREHGRQADHLRAMAVSATTAPVPSEPLENWVAERSIASRFGAIVNLIGRRQMRAILISGLALLALCCSASASDCTKSTAPAMAVICSDPALIDAREERQRAWRQARARLAGVRRQALVADQMLWLSEYPKSCGVRSTAKSPVTIDKNLQECFKRAIGERTAYLRAYGRPEPPLTKPEEEALSQPGVLTATATQELEKAPIAAERRSEWLDDLLAAWLRFRLTLMTQDKGDNGIAADSPPRLTGIVIQPGLRIAIFAAAGTESLVVTEGQTVSGWRVVNITPQEVFLSGLGGVTRLQPKSAPDLAASSLAARDRVRRPSALGQTPGLRANDDPR